MFFAITMHAQTNATLQKTRIATSAMTIAPIIASPIFALTIVFPRISDTAAPSLRRTAPQERARALSTLQREIYDIPFCFSSSSSGINKLTLHTDLFT